MKEKDKNLTDFVQDLYQKVDLSIDYALFLRLDIMSEENQLNKWVGIIQNKLKILIISLQKVKNLTFRLLPKLFDVNESIKTIIIGLKYKESKDINNNGHSFTEKTQK